MDLLHYHNPPSRFKTVNEETYLLWFKKNNNKIV